MSTRRITRHDAAEPKGEVEAPETIETPAVQAATALAPIESAEADHAESVAAPVEPASPS